MRWVVHAMGWLTRRSRSRTAEDAASPVFGYAQRLVEVTVGEIDRADTKASLLLAGTGVLFGAGTSVLVAEGPHAAHLATRITIPLFVALVSAVAAVIFLGCAAYPRGTIFASSRTARRIVYFRDVVRAGDAGHLKSAIIETISDGEDVVLEQLIQLSRIVARKYLLIRVAFIFLAIVFIAFAACAAGALIKLRPTTVFSAAEHALRVLREFRRPGRTVRHMRWWDVRQAGVIRRGWGFFRAGGLHQKANAS